MRIVKVTPPSSKRDGGALAYLKHDALGPDGDACVMLFNPGDPQEVTVDLSDLPSAVLDAGIVPTDLLDTTGGGSQPPPLKREWTVPMGAGEVKAFGGFTLASFAPRLGKRSHCVSDDQYRVPASSDTLQGCFLECLSDQRCENVFVEYVRITWMERPPPPVCPPSRLIRQFINQPASQSAKHLNAAATLSTRTAATVHSH